MGISGEQGTGQQAVADTQRGRFCRDRGGDLLYDDLRKRGRNGGSCACSISELPGGQRAAGTVPVDADECSAVFPIGLSLPFVLGKWKLSVPVTVVLACLSSAGIEYLQYRYSLGRCEVDDVIMNTLGALLGCSARWISHSWKRK